MEKFKKLIFRLFAVILILTSPFIGSHSGMTLSIENDSSSYIQRISKSYTKKYCNAIAFGLSKESAMNFSLEENNKVFEKKKYMKLINKDVLAEEIAISVVEKCGYPINLIGQKGIQEFKSYYLSKDRKHS
ncbi:hypothetical protein [Prochlorococcus marinus]|uniref:Uncharacterized protein n=1 Tax=Prochlorococcus marinus XMU1408 TaxID=2213228 RepID=A0A318R823_PROMR|nr:hypothetical protein [Prochlorococcus marinus]MBW3042441.1 hypothetical protein [Prochlorococcus marinus str. XMU1408]PYE01438.1 hypothetical protein DNJ73_07055 [Prochlorococcus marinus XMU1408]